jgi:hypothetical protein
MPTAVFAAKEKDDDMVLDAIQELTDIEPDYQEYEASDYGAAGPKPSKPPAVDSMEVNCEISLSSGAVAHRIGTVERIFA